MTDLEQNCWSEKVCQNCGSRLRREQHILTFGGVSKSYCSRFCYEHGLRLVAVSAPRLRCPASYEFASLSTERTLN